MASLLPRLKQQIDLPIFLVILLLITSFYFFIFSQTGLLSSGFRFFVDDHQIAAINHDLSLKSLPRTILDWLLLDNSARFRPAYYTHVILQTQIFGLNAGLWFGYLCLLTSLTNFSLFAFAKLLKIPTTLALLFSGLTLWGAQAVIWARPSLPEALGTFFLATSLMFAALGSRISKYQTVSNIIFATFAVLTSLSKESFIIFIPALVSIKIWSDSTFNEIPLRQALSQNKFLAGVLGGVMILEVLYIKFAIGTQATGYAGFDENNLKISNLLRTAATLTKASHPSFLGLAIALLIAIAVFKREPLLALFKKLYPVVFILLASIIPQILLYAKSGIDGYYLIPGILGYSLLTVVVLSLILERSKFLGFLLTTLAVILLCFQLPPMLSTYNQMAKDSRDMNALLQNIQSCTANEEPILVALNPRVRYEVAVSLKRTLNYAFQRNNLLVATYGLEKTNFFSDTLRDQEKIWSFLDPKTIENLYEDKTILNFPDKSKIKAVLVFDKLDNDFLKSSLAWFMPSHYKRSEYPISFAFTRLYCRQ
ncbi:MAG TPA: hypothetical protein V6C78_04260 [Crinalium sp.]|jgi:hypothetical protein